MQFTRNHQFWLLQLTGWTGWVVFLVVRDLAFVPAEYMLPRTVLFIADSLIGIVLTTILRHIYRKVWDASVPVKIAVVIFSCLLASLIWQPFKGLIILYFPLGETVDLFSYGWVRLYSYFLPVALSLILCWSVLYFLIKYYQLLQEEKEKSLRSKSLAHEARLRMLRYQLNPHFLFNTLNAISTLILEKATEPANEMVTKLSKFLRYSLDHEPMHHINLDHEINSAKLYLDIEKVRFEDRLRVNFTIEPEAEKALVPSMLLQPFIENSIKHAVAVNEQCGLIEINARVEKDQLILVVADDGPGMTNEDELSNVVSSVGVGLKNIRQRLEAMYNKDYEINFTQGQPTGCVVTVKIPYETE